jgi:hypothetical protein
VFGLEPSIEEKVLPRENRRVPAWFCHSRRESVDLSSNKIAQIRTTCSASKLRIFNDLGIWLAFGFHYQ